MDANASPASFTVSHAFPKTGLTCVLILRESHEVLHTWPETGTINIDIFSCTMRLRSVQAINELGQSFGARHVSIQELARADGHGPRRDAVRRGPVDRAHDDWAVDTLT